MAIKETIIARCDGNGCKTVAEIERGKYPAGWYRVNLVDEAGNLPLAKGFDLCSLKCVGKWSRARANFHVPPGKFPCGMCDFIGTSEILLIEHETSEHGFSHG